MRKTIALLALLAASAAAQTQPKPNTKQPDKALLQQVLDTWTSPSMDSVAQFYDQSPDDVFFDITPMKYQGFSDYLSGAKNVLAGVASLKFTVHDDASFHHSGDLVWATCTWQSEGKMKDGSAMTLAGRWTSIWQHKAGKWLIVHEQLSIPWNPGPPEKK